MATVTQISVRRRPLLGEFCAQRNGDREKKHRGELHHQERIAAVVKGGRAPRKREDRHQIKQYEGCDRGQSANDEHLWMRAKYFEHRHTDRFAVFQCGAKNRRFGDRQPDIKANQNERGTCEKRNPPAVGKEAVVRKILRQAEKNTAGEKESDGRAKLRKHSVPRALTGRSVFDCEQNRAAPFATEAQSLTQAAQRKQQRRHYADSRVRGKRADRDRRNAHREQERRPTSLFARFDRRNVRTGPSQTVEQRMRLRTWQATRAWPTSGRISERTGAERPALRRSRRCRNQRTRSLCRSGWQREPGRRCSSQARCLHCRRVCQD